LQAVPEEDQLNNPEDMRKALIPDFKVPPGLNLMSRSSIEGYRLQ